MNKIVKKAVTIATISAISGVLAMAEHHVTKPNTYNLPNLKMKDTKLSFDEIAGYEDYKVLATHFRKDKNEIRYIMANDVASGFFIDFFL